MCRYHSSSPSYRVAVLKPDHLGDLIITSPAIRALLVDFPKLDIFVSRGNSSLASYLFPNTKIYFLDVPHLSRSYRTSLNDYQNQLKSLVKYDLVIALRDDENFNYDTLHLFTKKIISSPYIEAEETHEARHHRNSISHLTGNYDISHFFFEKKDLKWPKTINILGLSIGASTFNKHWNILSWVELISLAYKNKIEVYLICGPSEIHLANRIASITNIKPDHIIVGSSDFPTFFKKISDIDIVICIDGGTSHLISLTKPVLTLFGSSPFRRFAPIGSQNRVLTLDLKCSPCTGFHSHIASGCVTQDCMNGLLPRAVWNAILHPSLAPGKYIKINSPPYPYLWFGLCH